VVVDPTTIAGGNDSIFNESVAPIGDKPVYVEKKKCNKQAIYIQ